MSSLSALQQLERLAVPCNSPHAVTALAVQLPQLRSVQLGFYGNAPQPLHASDSVALSLIAATALTELWLTVEPSALTAVQSLKMPPQLKALRVEIPVGKCQYDFVIVLDVLRALPLQHLTYLAVPGTLAPWPSQRGQQRPAQLPDVWPPLTQLVFGNDFREQWLHAYLWKLVRHAAEAAAAPRAAADPAADWMGVSDAANAALSAATHSTEPYAWADWRFRLSFRNMDFEMTVQDVLAPKVRHRHDGWSQASLRECMVSAHLQPRDVIVFGSGMSGQEAMLVDIVSEETQLRSLTVDLSSDAFGEHYSGTSGMHLGFRGSQGRIAGRDASFGSFKLLERLSVPLLSRLDTTDCCRDLRALTRLTHLMLPACGEITLAELACGVHASAASLRELSIGLCLDTATMEFLQPLTALTKLRLKLPAGDPLLRGTERLSWKQFKGRVFSIRQLEVDAEGTSDCELASALQYMPRLQELHLVTSGHLRGSCLSSLAERCPLLRVLRLDSLPRFCATSLHALRRLKDLASLSLSAVPLAVEACADLGGSLPPNLQTLLLHGNFEDAEFAMSSDGRLADRLISGFLACVPLPPPPLRWLAFEQPTVPVAGSALSALATAGGWKLATLERLDLSDVCAAGFEISQLSALPRLAQLSIGNVRRSAAELEADLVMIREAFAAAERPLVAVAGLDFV